MSPEGDSDIRGDPFETTVPLRLNPREQLWLLTGGIALVLSLGLVCNGTGLGRAVLVEIDQWLSHFPLVTLYEKGNAWYVELTGPCEPEVTASGRSSIYQKDVHQKIFQEPFTENNPDIYMSREVDCN